MEAIGGARRMISSSASNKALYVEQDLDGHTVTPYYSYGELDSQDAIDD
jgi:hypothetical protein